MNPSFQPNKKNNTEESEIDPSNSFIQPQIQRHIQRQLKPAITPAYLPQQKNGKLPAEVQSKMENSFGEDFSNVNIHTDSDKATELGAKAYAQGKDLHFAPGEFQPNSKQGQELIGHELTHVVQQKEGVVQGGEVHGKDLVNQDVSLEKEADDAGKLASEGALVNVKGNGSGIQMSGEGDREIAYNPLQPGDIILPGPARMKELLGARAGSGMMLFQVNPRLLAQGKKETAFTQIALYLIEYKNFISRVYPHYDSAEGMVMITDKANQSIGFYKKQEAALNKVAETEYGRQLTSESLKKVQPVKQEVKLADPFVPGPRKISNDKLPVAFRKEADPGAPILAMLPFNTTVDAKSLVDGGWAKVVYGSLEGYVQSNALSKPMPATEVSLYRIKSGDSMENMFYNMGYGTKVPEKSFLEKMKFEDSPLDVANDPRFFANALYYLNNQTFKKDPAVYMEGGGNLNLFDMATNEEYKRLKLKEGYMMWLPTKQYVRDLVGVVKPGSVKGNMEFSVAKQVEKYWPDGFGVFLETGLGATFGIPVGVDGDQAFYALREGDNIIIKAQYSIAAGLDTGIGAGVFYGNGKADAKGQKIGVGAQAGANAEAKLKSLTYDEYEFPFKMPGAMASAMFIALSKSQLGTIGLQGFMGQTTRYLGTMMTNPEKYLTKRKSEFGLATKGTAEANMGIHTGKTDEGKNTSSWKSKDKAPDDASSAWTPDSKLFKNTPLGSIVRNMTNNGISAQVCMEALGGIETNIDNDDIISNTYLQFTTGSDVVLPAVLAPIQALFPGNGGFSIIVQSKYKKGAEEKAKHSLVFKIIKGSGNTDFMKGSGTEITLPPLTFEELPGYFQKIKNIFSNPNSDLKSIVGLFNDMEIEKIMEFPLAMGGFEKRLARQQGVKRLLKDNLSKSGLLGATGVNLSGVLHAKLVFKDLESKLDEILLLIKKIKGLDIKTLYQIVTDYFFHGKLHPEFMELINLFLQITEVKELDVTVTGSVGVAGSASGAFGAKVRAMGYAQGGVFHKFDLPIGGEIKTETISELLTGAQ